MNLIQLSVNCFKWDRERNYCCCCDGETDEDERAICSINSPSSRHMDAVECIQWTCNYHLKWRTYISPARREMKSELRGCRRYRSDRTITVSVSEVHFSYSSYHEIKKPSWHKCSTERERERGKKMKRNECEESEQRRKERERTLFNIHLQGDVDAALFSLSLFFLRLLMRFSFSMKRLDDQCSLSTSSSSQSFSSCIFFSSVARHLERLCVHEFIASQLLHLMEKKASKCTMK